MRHSLAPPKATSRASATATGTGAAMSLRSPDSGPAGDHGARAAPASRHLLPAAVATRRRRPAARRARLVLEFWRRQAAVAAARSGYGSSGLWTRSTPARLLKHVGVPPDSRPPTDDQKWLTTVIGFRGDAVALATGEEPDWSVCSTGSTTGSAASAPPAAAAGAPVPAPVRARIPHQSTALATPTPGSSGGIAPAITQRG